MENLPDKVCVSFTKEGKQKIRGKLNKFIEGKKKRNIMETFGYGLFFYLDGKSNFVSLGTLRRIVKVLGSTISELEKYVITLKPSSSSKVIQIIGLPINMCSREGAIILGSFPDVGISRYVVSSIDEIFVDDFREASHKILGNFEDTVSPFRGGLKRYYATNLLRDICDISGYNTTIKQVISNNPVPLWVFSAPEQFLKLFLSRMWDADGTVDKRSKKLRFSQAFIINSTLLKEFIKNQKKESITFKSLPGELKTIVLDNPPHMLISMCILLKMIRIDSRIHPERIYITKDRLPRCEWSLRITSYKNIESFSKKVGFGLERKKENLESLLKSYRRIQRRRERYFILLKEIKEKEFITNGDAAKELALSKGGAYLNLRLLKRKGLISYERRKLNRGNYRPWGFVYKITNKGRNWMRKYERQNLGRSLSSADFEPNN